MRVLASCPSFFFFFLTVKFEKTDITAGMSSALLITFVGALNEWEAAAAEDSMEVKSNEE
jgi:hypothetical protein